MRYPKFINRGTKKIILSSIMMLVICMSLILSIKPHYSLAQNATAYTYTISVKDEWIRTQDAYVPGKILFKDMELQSPEDIFISTSAIYIADTGAGRIVAMDRATGNISIYGEDILDSPTGIFVNDEGNMFIADYGLEKVIILSPKGKVISEYERPDSPIFGEKTNYKPRKVASDKRGNIYIVGEGAYDGIIQLSNKGEFMGYFGSNKTKISLLQIIQDALFTKDQKAKLFHRIPRSYYNVAIDEKGMVYTATQLVRRDAIKKHNTSGVNILNNSRAGKMIDENNFVDIAVGRYGQIYGVTETGLIYEYDLSGELIFSLGGRAISTERNGLFTVAAGIDVDEADSLYILDKERGIVQVFYPTEFANKTHMAMDLFQNGEYSKSKEIWTQLLKLNSVSKIAHNGMGKGYFQEGNYEKAAHHFKIAGNREDYSNVWWELRNLWLQKNMVWIFAVVLILIIGSKLIKLFKGKKDIESEDKDLEKKLGKYKWASDIVYIKNLIKHPIDSFYYIRKDEKASLGSATIIYFLFVVVFTFDYLYRGFIFTGSNNEISPLYILLITVAPQMLWVISNYLVSSINDGEGRLRDVYISTAYSFAPYILFGPIVIGCTYFFTMNEKFLIDFPSLILWTWSGVIMFISIKEIHDYNLRNTFKNIFLTVFCMLVIVVTGSILYMLGDQVVEFVYNVVKEVAYRVQ